MATGTANVSTNTVTDPVQTEQYIVTQLDKTRSQLKINDLFAMTILFAAGILGFFLLVAVLDHWILPLGFWGRLSALLILVGGSGYFALRVFLPLLVRHINPAYAARVIEKHSPSLKNSLLNFWLLRGNRTVVHDVVYQALGQRVATDLSGVSVEWFAASRLNE